MYDVIIVGGGPAGLSAALVLGRCRRSVLVVDGGEPRNRASRAMHGYLTRDGVAPAELLRLARDEIKSYGVEIRHATVTEACQVEAGFEVTLDIGNRFQSRKLVLATGLRDQIPRIDGIEALYGISVHHCPYCDAYKWRDRRIGAIGRGRKGIGLALALRTWTKDVVLLTNGSSAMANDHRERLETHGIAIESRRIASLEGTEDGKLQRIRFRSGEARDCDALFFNTSQQQTSDLAVNLGCTLTRNGGIRNDRRERTGIPGLFVVGDACKEVEFVVVAAAEGATAAVTINREIQEEEGRSLP